MPNTLLTPNIIAKEALMLLKGNLGVSTLVHNDYSNEFVKVGDTVTVRKPATFKAKNFTGETSAQDVAEGSVAVKMDRFRDVTVEITSKEMTLDLVDFSKQIVAPAMKAIAEQIDTDVLATLVAGAGKSVSVSSPAVISDVANVGKELDISKAPRDDRHLILPPELLYKYNTLDNFAKVAYKGDSEALKDSEVGKVYTCDTFMSQYCPINESATAGTVTAYKVTGTVDTKQFTVSAGSPATGTIKKGDKLIVNGYLYTCDEDLTLASGAGTLKVAEEIAATITTAVSVTIVNKAHGVGFHRNGCTFVTRNLELPMGNKNAHVESADGISVRVVFDYDAKHKKDTISFDVIYGIKPLEESLIVDFA